MFGIADKGKNPAAKELLKEFEAVAKSIKKEHHENVYHPGPGEGPQEFSFDSSFSDSSDDAYEGHDGPPNLRTKPEVPPKPKNLHLLIRNSASLPNGLGESVLRPRLSGFSSIRHSYISIRSDQVDHDYVAPMSPTESFINRHSYLSIRPNDQDHIYEELSLYNIPAEPPPPPSSTLAGTQESSGELDVDGYISPNDQSSSSLKLNSPEFDFTDGSTFLKSPPVGRKPSGGIRPLPPTPEDSNGVPQTPPEWSLLRGYPWFRNVRRKLAEKELRKDGRNGVFLVRPSKHGGSSSPLTLTLLFNGQIFNVSIRKLKDGKFGLGKEKKSNDLVFESVQDIVKRHRYEKLVLVDKKGDPTGSTILAFYPPMA